MTRRTNRILLMVVLVAFINLPVLHSTWTRWQVERNGTDTVAEVEDTRVLGDEAEPSYWLVFRLPRLSIPDQLPWSAQVERETYQEADAEGSVDVRVLESRPSAHIVEGQIRNPLGSDHHVDRGRDHPGRPAARGGDGPSGADPDRRDRGCRALPARRCSSRSRGTSISFGGGHRNRR